MAPELPLPASEGSLDGSPTACQAYEGDMPWLDERLEELQRQIGMEMNSQEERLEEEFVNLKALKLAISSYRVGYRYRYIV